MKLINMSYTWIYKFILVLSLKCSHETATNGRFGSFHSGETNKNPAHYSFRYDVSEPSYSNFYGHSERRSGHRTEGEYYVRLPDNRMQKVSYYADETGYHPTITYEQSPHESKPFPHAESNRKKPFSQRDTVRKSTAHQMPRPTALTRNTPPEFLVNPRLTKNTFSSVENSFSPHESSFGNKVRTRPSRPIAFPNFVKRNRPIRLRPTGVGVLKSQPQQKLPVSTKIPSPLFKQTSLYVKNPDLNSGERRQPHQNLLPPVNVVNRFRPMMMANKVPSFVKSKSIKLEKKENSSSENIGKSLSSAGTSIFNPKVFSSSFLSTPNKSRARLSKALLNSNLSRNNLFVPVDPDASVVPKIVTVVIPVEDNGDIKDFLQSNTEPLELEDYIDDNYL